MREGELPLCGVALSLRMAECSERKDAAPTSCQSRHKINEMKMACHNGDSPT